eukprot:jgi/Bigna1/141363/aug1.62_g16071
MEHDDDSSSNRQAILRFQESYIKPIVEIKYLSRAGPSVQEKKDRTAESPRSKQSTKYSATTVGGGGDIPPLDKGQMAPSLLLPTSQEDEQQPSPIRTREFYEGDHVQIRLLNNRLKKHRSTWQPGIVRAVDHKNTFPYRVEITKKADKKYRGEVLDTKAEFLKLQRGSPTLQSRSSHRPKRAAFGVPPPEMPPPDMSIELPTDCPSLQKMQSVEPTAGLPSPMQSVVPTGLPSPSQKIERMQSVEPTIISR